MPAHPRRTGLAVAAALTLISADAGIAEIFVWRDGKGITHYSDAPPPAGTAGVRAGAGTGAVSVVPSAPQEQGGSPRAARPGPGGERTPAPAVRPAPSVEVYGTSWCPACRKAKDYFEGRGIPFRYSDIEANPEARRRKGEITREPVVPVVVIDGQVFTGFQAASFERALRSPR